MILRVLKASTEHHCSRNTFPAVITHDQRSQLQGRQGYAQITKEGVKDSNCMFNCSVVIIT